MNKHNTDAMPIMIIKGVCSEHLWKMVVTMFGQKFSTMTVQFGYN